MARPKGYKHTARTRRLMSLKASGKNNPFFGKKHSAVTKRKSSLAMRGKNNPMFGKHHTLETKQKIRLTRLRLYRKR